MPRRGGRALRGSWVETEALAARAVVAGSLCGFQASRLDAPVLPFKYLEELGFIYQNFSPESQKAGRKAIACRIKAQGPQATRRECRMLFGKLADGQ